VRRGDGADHPAGAVHVRMYVCMYVADIAYFTHGIKDLSPESGGVSGLRCIAYHHAGHHLLIWTSFLSR
jgi:hypothetical protein